MYRFHFPRKALLSITLLTASLAGQLGSAQQKSTFAQKERLVRVGIALMMNQSRRMVSPKWERDQLVRNLRGLRTDRKSSVVIEAVPLDASSQEDAGAEAAQKDCQYFVLTTLVDVGRGPGISVGPDGMHPNAVILGNANPDRSIALDFSIFEIGRGRTLAEGRAVAPEEDRNETRAADEAMRITSVRVANELRKERSPNID